MVGFVNIMSTVSLRALCIMIAYHPQILLKGNHSIVFKWVLEVAVKHFLQRDSVVEAVSHVVECVQSFSHTNLGILEFCSHMVIPFLL